MEFLPSIVQIIVQLLATIFFVRVARWDLFSSAGSAAVVAMAAASAIHFAQSRGISRRKGDL